MEDNNVIDLVKILQQKKEIIFDAAPYHDHSGKVPNQWRRIFSFAIDFIAILFIKTLVDISYAGFVNSFLYFLSYSQKSALINMDMITHFSLFSIIFITYFTFCLYAFEGKTIGKKMLGLNIASEHFFNTQLQKDHTLQLKSCFYRALGYYFGYLSFGLLFTFSLISDDSRGIPDYISQSRSVTDDFISKQKDFKDQYLIMLEHQEQLASVLSA